ncbi:MAG: hypothetical protein KC416_04640 [Myxococcales bacterium]|nr:hypothetical protein [Myxococcales bacterium]
MFLALLLIPGCNGAIPSDAGGPRRDASSNAGDASADGGGDGRAEQPEGPRCENDLCEIGETPDNCPWDCQPTLPRVLPNLFIKTASGTSRIYNQDAAAPGPGWSFSDDLIEATITDEGEGFYRLDLTAKVAIDSIAFPFMHEAIDVSGPGANDKVFYPWLGGGFEPEGTLAPFAWRGFEYPGAFAPLIITAGPEHGLLVAAVNWPPVEVMAAHAQRQNAVFYRHPIAAASSVRYRSLVTRVRGAPGYKAWHIAMNRYAKWFYSHFKAPEPPTWMIENEGFLNVQLENFMTFDIAQLEKLWSEKKDRWNLMLLWGQMSDYAGACCAKDRDMHSRYLPELPAFVAGVAKGGGHIGYYTREPAVGHIAESPGVDWYKEWVAKNATEYGANTTYLDVVCRGRASVPNSPVRLPPIFLDGTVPTETVCEGFQDVYPNSAGLLSGFLLGDSNFNGGEGITPELVDGGTYTNLVRFLMRDRLGYIGGSNGDHKVWGTAADYYVERQAFLLGLKLDIIHWRYPDEMVVATEIADLRAKAGWWKARPTYMDTVGLLDVPGELDVRRHVTRDGRNLFTITNWKKEPGLSFRHGECVVGVPADRLSIVESPCG